jgi:hypothetical protein
LWCAPRTRSKLDLVSFRHPAEQREDVLEGEGMHLDGAPAAGVFGNHHRIAVLVRAARAVDSTPILVATPPITTVVTPRRRSCTPWPTR